MGASVRGVQCAWDAEVAAVPLWAPKPEGLSAAAAAVTATRLVLGLQHGLGAWERADAPSERKWRQNRLSPQLCQLRRAWRVQPHGTGTWLLVLGGAAHGRTASHTGAVARISQAVGRVLSESLAGSAASVTACRTHKCAAPGHATGAQQVPRETSAAGEKCTTGVQLSPVCRPSHALCHTHARLRLTTHLVATCSGSLPEHSAAGRCTHRTLCDALPPALPLLPRRPPPAARPPTSLPCLACACFHRRVSAPEKESSRHSAATAHELPRLRRFWRQQQLQAWHRPGLPLHRVRRRLPPKPREVPGLRRVGQSEAFQPGPRDTERTPWRRRCCSACGGQVA